MNVTQATTPPPPPTAPHVCRWCAARRVRLDCGVWYCPNSCADNDVAPFLGFCEDCRREFRTGRQDMHQCWLCAGRERRALVAQYDGPELSATGFDHDMRANGVSRRAFEALQSEPQPEPTK